MASIVHISKSDKGLVNKAPQVTPAKAKFDHSPHEVNLSEKSEFLYFYELLILSLVASSFTSFYLSLSSMLSSLSAICGAG